MPWLLALRTASGDRTAFPLASGFLMSGETAPGRIHCADRPRRTTVRPCLGLTVLSEGKTIKGRVACGRSARTARREGRPQPMGLP